MSRLDTVHVNDLDAKGKVRRKYEIDEDRQTKGGVVASAIILIAGALLAMKSVLFGRMDVLQATNELKTTASENLGSIKTEEGGLDAATGRSEESERGNYGGSEADARDGGTTFSSAFSVFSPEDYTPYSWSPQSNAEVNGLSKSNVKGSSQQYQFDNIVAFPGAEPVSLKTPAAQSSSSQPRNDNARKEEVDIDDPYVSDPDIDSPDIDNPYEEDPGVKKDPKPINRLPVVTAPVILSDIYVNQSIIIAMSSLLGHVTDADGDPLHVVNLKSSSGQLSDNEDGTWTFAPDAYDRTSVSFTYDITDQIGTTQQTAELDIQSLPGQDIEGTDDDDVIIGSPGRDTIISRGGNDKIISREDSDLVDAGSGDDIIFAGEGDDIIYGGSGNDIVFAGIGDDVVFGGAGDDIIYGQAGSDTLFGEEGDDLLVGGEGDDQLSGGPGADELQGGAGADFLSGDEGADLLYAGAGDDLIIGGKGSDIAEGGAGDDVFIATPGDGDDLYDAGAGIDSYIIAGTTAAATIDLVLGTADSTDIGHDVLVDFENVVGSDGNDFIIGDDASNELTGGTGEDHVSGGAGDDTFINSIGDDDDHYDGGDGIDTYDLSQTTADAVIDLSLGEASSDDTGRDRLINIENVIGGDGDDTIYGDDASNELTGGAGHDDLEGGDGDDTFINSIGDDDDHYDGGDGIDTYDLSQITADAVIDLSLGEASSDDSGRDRLYNIENVIGGDGDDTIYGDDASNELTGGAGHDDLDGGDGDDSFISSIEDDDDHYDGGDGIDTYDLSQTTADAVIDLSLGEASSDDTGRDRLFNIENVIGGDGDDRIVANDSVNLLSGGGGEDIFSFKKMDCRDGDHGRGNRDVIDDFAIGDHLDFSDFAADPDIDGWQKLTFIYDQAEFDTVGQIKYEYETFEDREFTIVEIKITLDVDGDNDADCEIELVGRHELDAENIWF